MTTVTQHDVYGQITYEESFWTGKKTITIENTPLSKTDKTHYAYTVDGETVAAEVKGNSFMGVTLTIKNETIYLSQKPAWYVLALSVLMFIFVIVWGNSPTLCEIFPIVGGAIGGFVSALFAMLNVSLANKTKKSLFKILIGLGLFVATVLVCYAITSALLSAVASLT